MHSAYVTEFWPSNKLILPGRQDLAALARLPLRPLTAKSFCIVHAHDTADATDLGAGADIEINFLLENDAAPTREPGPIITLDLRLLLLLFQPEGFSTVRSPFICRIVLQQYITVDRRQTAADFGAIQLDLALTLLTSRLTVVPGSRLILPLTTEISPSTDTPVPT